MKKIFSLFIALTAVFSLSAKTLYLAPTELWTGDNAKFSVYAFNDNVEPKINAWVDMVAVEGEKDIYSADVDEKYPNVIFCRVDPNGTNEDKWKNVWNQSEDLSVPTDEKDLFTIQYKNEFEPNKDKYHGEWSKFVPAEPEPEYRLENGFYLMGSMLDWKLDNVNEAHKFVANEAKEGEWVLAKVELAEKDSFKVIEVAADTIKTWFGTDEDNYIVDAKHAGEEKDIYFNPTRQENWKGHIWVEANKEPEPEYRLENGFYLIGSMLDWKLENVTEVLKFIENADKDGEWVLAKVELAEADTFKVIEVAADTVKAWFGMDEDKNYVVDAKHAGEEKDIYFNPTRQEDWKGHIWINANPEPEPEYRLENGFYLMGSMLDWKLENVNEAHKFVANEAKEGEWVLAKVELAEKDSFKVIEVAADTIKTWFGTDEDNYIVDAKHAGEEKDIYFNPKRQEDWKGHIWINANPEPEPEYRLENGFYLIGSMLDWKLDNVKEAHKFVANEAKEGEWVLAKVELAEKDSFKVIEVAADTIKTWFGTDEDNYIVDAKHAGEKDIYFNVARVEDWKGHIWVEANKEPEPEYRLENGFYLIGSMLDWKLDNVNEAHKFIANEAKEGEWVLAKVELAEKDSFKVIEVAADTIKTWFGTDEDNYIVDAKHAGEKDIYFNVARVEDWKGHIWVEANKEPEPEYRLENGFYLIGSMLDWKLDNVNEAHKFVANEAKEGEWVLAKVALAEADTFKVIEVAADTIKAWFGMDEDKNYVVDAKHAGEKDIYFNVARVEDWKGHIWVEANKEPEPEYRLENGFYLIGSMLDWKLDNVNEAHKFVANEAKEGEWVLAKVALAEADTFKVIEVAADTIKAWFGMDEDKNYVVDAKHAGEKDIYFNVARVEDWKGHIWVEANKEPEPEPLADGYYLVGTFNDWTASAEVKLALNEAVAAQGVEEYAINIELAEGDSLKVVKIAGEERTWFPKDKNVGIDADHAGKKDVYFRPAGKDEWKEFDESGFFWIDANEPSAVENTEATVKAVKTLKNGMLIIEKNGVRYTVMGQIVR